MTCFECNCCEVRSMYCIWCRKYNTHLKFSYAKNGGKAEKCIQDEKDIYLLKEFCKIWKVNPEDMMAICEGHFEEWYKDFLLYMRNEMHNRIATGKYRKIDINDVWGGSKWTEQYV